MIVANYLFSRTVIISNKSQCTKVTADHVEVLENWASDHEEADTKLVALVKAVNLSPDDAVMARSPSGDVDILALFLSHEFDGTRILVDNGVGKQRKIIDMTSSTLEIEKKKHYLAFTLFLAMTMQANGLMLQLDAPVDHGWNEAGSVRWSDTCYPEDISELLLNQVEVNEELEAESVECSDSEDDFEEPRNVLT
eukprot:gene14878-biopygen12404